VPPPRRRRPATLTAFCLVVCALLLTAAAPALGARPFIHAHRGGSLEFGVPTYPENTLPAFRAAAFRGFVLELDVKLTKDLVPVVIHDATLDRTTDGSGPVAAYTERELAELDAGYRYTPDGGRTFPYRGAGARISTLREVLAALPHARVNVEIKDGRAQEAVQETIREAGAEHRVLVAAGDRRNRSRFAAYPGPTSAGYQEMYTFYGLHQVRCTRFWRPPVDAFQMPDVHNGRRALSPRWVREAHALNMAVHVWTIDAEADMRRLLEWDVDGIITDRPDRLARVLHEVEGRSLPPGPPPEETPEWLAAVLRDELPGFPSR
jgi:glycerophosphoryl diester phosphodiesterase